MDAGNLKFLTTLVEYPEESAQAEYKSAVAFDPKTEFGAKLVKHILGLANSGGGYIVIGFQEDSSRALRSDPSLTEAVSGSFETTRLCQSVDSFLAPGQRIKLQVHKIQHKEKTYPLISIDGYRDSPYFCKREVLDKNSKPILKEGALYVRDLAAKTTVAAGPEHWNTILKRAIEQKQTELVDLLRSLLGQLGLSIPASASLPENEKSWYSSESQSARSMLERAAQGSGIFEVWHHAAGPSKSWHQSDLAIAAEKSVVRKTGWPMGMVMRKPEFAPKATSVGVRATIDAMGLGKFDYWSLDKTGHYFFLRRLDEDSDDRISKSSNKWIYFDTRIWRVAEALLHCSNLYRELGLPPETQIDIRIFHLGLRDRLLGVADRSRLMSWNRKCEEAEAEWSGSFALGSIESNLQDLTREVTNQLFVLFEFWEPTETVFKEVFASFLSSRI